MVVVIHKSYTVQSCVKTFLLSFKNYTQNCLLPTQKMYYGATVDAGIPKTWQE